MIARHGYSILTTLSLTFGKRVMTCGSWPGTISRGWLAIVFIRSCAPRRSLSRQAIGGLVRAASVRAGLTPHGPHRLRHTVATELQHRGAPLAEIAQLLRHQGVQTTAVYAKVDRRALSSLAQPWPGATG